MADFITNYLPLMIAPILFGAATFVMKSSFVKAEEMDFVSGIQDVTDATYDEPPPKNIWEKFWLWIVSTFTTPFPLKLGLITCLLFKVLGDCKPG